MAAMIEAPFTAIINVASVPHRSPFRYPGGKTWLIPLIRTWLRSFAPIDKLIEPFAGGAIVGLTAIFEQLAPVLTLVELDSSVAAVWQTIFGGDAGALAERIVAFEMTLANARDTLARNSESRLDQAFVTILRNRVQRGGILAPGASLMKAGENGRGVNSRWYANTLRQRILDLDAIRDRVTVIQGDGITALREAAPQRRTAFFIDPPYTIAGRRLYTHSDIDHAELFRVAGALAGDFLMTYDNTDDVRELATQSAFDTLLVPMKSTHHERKAELLIGRDLEWVRRQERFGSDV